VRLEFSERLAHRIEAASDLFLMPSRYEPCGLNQLYSLRYGAIPIISSTGGLVDTVTDTNQETLESGTATGFRFAGYSLDGLEKTLEQAVDFYLHRKPEWAQIVQTAMRMDWSWKKSAERYLAVFEDTLKNRP
jgi:starch synthase